MFNKKVKEVDTIELGADLYLKGRLASKKELTSQIMSTTESEPVYEASVVKPILVEQLDDGIEEAKKILALYWKARA
jgi:hypothetical protein